MTYRRVLGLPGALVFSMSGLVARLPISMISLGIVVLVSTRTGSYSLAGSVSAAYLVAGAVCAVLQARLIDRLGQSRVLPVAVAVFAAGLVAMMSAVETDRPAPWPHLFAAGAGAALPQVSSCVRARWAHLVSDKQDLHTAFAFEAVVDETVFIVGPALVTVLATTVHPLAGLGAAVLAALVGTAVLVWLAQQYTFGGGAVGVTALSIASTKTGLGFGQAIVLGALCNALVCLAVWLTYGAHTTADKILAVIPPIAAFVALGFEHSVANMYFIPVALLIKTDDVWVDGATGLPDLSDLTWQAFLLDNLLPVTIGNIIGGGVMVGAVYWFVYLRPRRASS